MSVKNKLQEIYQKHGLTLPRYHSSQIDGPAHNPVWVSEVELVTGERIKGEPASSKTAAEQSAALAALMLLEKKEREPIESIPVEDRTVLTKGCLLIDGENLPNLAKFVSTLSSTHFEIMIFVGHHHHLSERDYGPYVQKVLVPTTHANGVDSCMQAYVGTFLLTEKYDCYLIGTRDHFGSALIDLIQSREMPWPAKTATLITTENQLQKYL